MCKTNNTMHVCCPFRELLNLKAPYSVHGQSCRSGITNCQEKRCVSHLHEKWDWVTVHNVDLVIQLIWLQFTSFLPRNKKHITIFRSSINNWGYLILGWEDKRSVFKQRKWETHVSVALWLKGKRSQKIQRYWLTPTELLAKPTFIPKQISSASYKSLNSAFKCFLLTQS